MAIKRRISSLLIAFTLPLLFIVLAGCGTTETITGGYADKASIVIGAERNYTYNYVDLYVDGVLLQKSVKVVVKQDVTRTGKRVDIDPGQHEVVIKDRQGRELHRSKIFVSAGKSKVIILP